MSPLFRILLCVLASPALLYAAHLVVVRLFRKGSPHSALTWLIIVMQAAVLVLVWAAALQGSSSGLQALAALAYASVASFGFSVIYFFVFIMGETGRRIRILHEIRESSALSEAQILSLYSSDDILDMRLARLVEMGQLSCEGRRYRLNERGLLYLGARLVAGWGEVLGLRVFNGPPPVRESSGRG
jgi:hypothetical protein